MSSQTSLLPKIIMDFGSPQQNAVSVEHTAFNISHSVWSMEKKHTNICFHFWIEIKSTFLRLKYYCAATCQGSFSLLKRPHMSCCESNNRSSSVPLYYWPERRLPANPSPSPVNVSFCVQNCVLLKKISDLLVIWIIKKHVDLRAWSSKGSMAVL